MIKPEILEKLRVVTEEEQKILEGKTGIDRAIYMENRENSISSQKMLGKGKWIAIRPATRFVHFPKHSHDFVEIVYMCSGSTTQIVNGNTITLKKGEILFLCQNAKQEILPAGIDDIAVNFMIRPEFFDQTLSMIGEEDTPLRRFLVDCLKNNRESKGYLHFQVADVIPVQNLLENLIWTLLQAENTKRNIIQTTMGLLFLQLIDYADKLVYLDEEEKIAVKVLKYIEENYQQGSLAELAKELHYSESVLSREIKNKTGKNYSDLLQEKRLSQACFFLKNTNMAISEVAEKIGYHNISFFYRIFKKRFGISPKTYQKQKN